MVEERLTFLSVAGYKAIHHQCLFIQTNEYERRKRAGLFTLAATGLASVVGATNLNESMLI
jgi:hypothetical protein